MSSPPRDEFVRPNMQDRDPERDAGVSPESFGRRRAVNWLDEDFSRQTSPRASRRYGATSNAASREQSRAGERVPVAASLSRSRSRSASPDLFV